MGSLMVLCNIVKKKKEEKVPFVLVKFIQEKNLDNSRLGTLMRAEPACNFSLNPMQNKLYKVKKTKLAVSEREKAKCQTNSKG